MQLLERSICGLGAIQSALLSSSDQPRVNFFPPLLKILYPLSPSQAWLKEFQAWVEEQTEPPPQLGCQET